MISSRKKPKSSAHLKAIGVLSQRKERVRIFFQSLSISENSVKLFSTLMGLALLGLLAFFVPHLSHLNSEYSFSQFFPKGHELLNQSQKIRQTFQLEERSAFLLIVEKSHGTWLEKKSLAQLKKLTERLSAMPRIQSVLSLATIEGAQDLGKNLAIGPLFEKRPEKSWAEFTRNNSLLRSQLISENFRSVLLIVEPAKMKPADLQETSLSLKKIIQDSIPNVKVQVGGLPAIQGQFSDILFREMKLFMVLSLLIFCCVFLFFFKGISAFVLTFSGLILSNMVVVGILAYFKIPFSVLLSSLPIITSIALISLMIHSLHRWAEALQNKSEGSLRERLVLSWSVLREMALPNFLGSITTAIGFATLCITDIPLIRQYGWVVAGSVMVSWILTQVILLGFMFWTKPVLRSWTTAKSFWTLPILKWSAPLFVVIIGCSALFGLLGKGVSFSGRLFDDLPKSQSARQATEKIDRDFGGVVPYDLVLTAKAPHFWREPANLEKLERALLEIRKDPAVGSVLSFTSFFNRKAAKTRAEVSEIAFLFSMAEKNPLANYLTEDGKSLRVALRFHDLPTRQIESTRAWIKEQIEQTFSGKAAFRMEESGLAVISHTINQEVAKGLVGGFWHSLVLIGLLLAIVFRSLRWALIACLPNLIPPAILLGALALSQTPVKPGVALIFSIALGLAFNNTVYLLSRLKSLKEEKKMNTLPLKRALLQEGNPCLFETLIMFFGFLIFLSSRFGINQTFGLYMLLSIAAGAVADLVFLPTLLRLFPEVVSSRKSVSQVVLSKKTAGNIAAGFLFSFFLMASPSSQAVVRSPEASEILAKVRSQIDSKDDQARVHMKIVEANGEIKNRDLKLQTLRSKDFYALARIQSPADIKGTGFLVQINRQEQKQWLYLPSSKQVRRIVGTKKTAGILGSELTIEDLNPTAIQSSRVQVLRKTGSEWVLQASVKRGTSIYNRVLIFISLQQFVPLKTEYYQNNKLKKTVEFLRYIKVGTAMRAQTILVKNRVNRRSTQIELTEIKVNSGLSESDFSPHSLKAD